MLEISSIVPEGMTKKGKKPTPSAAKSPPKGAKRYWRPKREFSRLFPLANSGFDSLLAFEGAKNAAQPVSMEQVTLIQGTRQRRST